MGPDVRGSVSHNDVTFLDGFLTKEFVVDNEYFTYEFTRTTRRLPGVEYGVRGREEEADAPVHQLRKADRSPSTTATTTTSGELLLGHHYNGVMLDLEQATRTLERIYELWGHPVNLKTIVKEFDEHDAEIARRRDREPEPEEQGKTPPLRR